MVRRLSLTLALALLLPAAVCRPMAARTEVTPGTDFSRYDTYRWLTDDLVLLKDGHGDNFIRSAETEQRIRVAVERGLEAKGLAKAEGDAASLIVAFTVGTKLSYTIGDGSTYETEEQEPPSTVIRARLRLYVFDAASKQQVWEAWATRNINGQEKDQDAEVNAAVDLLLAQYPGS